MDLMTFNRESIRNRQAFERLRARIHSDYPGQYVALANGMILGAAPTFDGARGLIEKMNPVPEYYLIFPADTEPDFDLAYDLSESR